MFPCLGHKAKRTDEFGPKGTTLQYMEYEGKKFLIPKIHMPSSAAFLFYLQITDIVENNWNRCFTGVCFNPKCLYSTHSLEQWQAALLAGDTGPGCGRLNFIVV